MIENLLPEAGDPHIKAAPSFRTYMAQAQRLTTSNALFDQVQSFVDHPEQATEFGLLRIEREADRLASVDAADASLIKAAIAALRWDKQGVDYWVDNALRLSRSPQNLINSAVSKGLVCDFRAGADLAVEAFTKQSNDLDAAIRACEALFLNARYEEAIVIAEKFGNASKEFEDLFRQATAALSSIKEIGLELNEVQRQLEIGVRTASEMRVRVKSVEAFTVRDFDDGDRLVVRINVKGDINIEIALDEALVIKFLDDPKWDPMKLSIEFQYLTGNELQAK